MAAAALTQLLRADVLVRGRHGRYIGTIVADVLHVATGLSYCVTSAFYAAVVGALFTLWWQSEGTLSIHSIITVRRERFYLCTVLATSP